MAIGNIPVTLVGNLTRDIDLRTTNEGKAVASFVLACTPQQYNAHSGRYENGETVFIRCTAWGMVAQNLAHSARKGMRIIAVGTLIQSTWTGDDGTTKSQIQARITTAGVDLTFQRASVTKVRDCGDSNGGSSWGAQSNVQPPF